MYLRFGGSGLLIGLAVIAVGKVAHAGTIVTSAGSCHASLGTDVAIVATDGLSVWGIGSVPVGVSCAIPRAPVTGATTLSFVVEGLNAPGGSVTCTLSLESADRTVTLSSRFTEAQPAQATTLQNWRHPVSFTVPASVSDTITAGLRCNMPALGPDGANLSLLRGVISS